MLESSFEKRRLEIDLRGRSSTRKSLKCVCVYVDVDEVLLLLFSGGG